MSGNKRITTTEVTPRTNGVLDQLSLDLAVQDAIVQVTDMAVVLQPRKSEIVMFETHR